MVFCFVFCFSAERRKRKKKVKVNKSKKRPLFLSSLAKSFPLPRRLVFRRRARQGESAVEKSAFLFSSTTFWLFLLFLLSAKTFKVDFSKYLPRLLTFFIRRYIEVPKTRVEGRNSYNLQHS